MLIAARSLEYFRGLALRDRNCFTNCVRCLQNPLAD
jgi:hypothetical protein